MLEVEAGRRMMNEKNFTPENTFQTLDTPVFGALIYKYQDVRVGRPNFLNPISFNAYHQKVDKFLSMMIL